MPHIDLIFSRFRRRQLASLIGGCLALLLGPISAQALVISNATPVNVTAGSFSIVAQTFTPATPGIAVFSDVAGQNNLAGTLSVEVFPLNTGNPNLLTDFDRRTNQFALQQLTKNLGLVQVRVSGCAPNTTYYYQLSVTDTNGATVFWPASGTLPSVTTPNETLFVLDAKELIMDVGGNAQGEIIILSNTNTAYPLAAVVGDGAGTNQVYFSLSDLYALAGATNYVPLGTLPFTATLLGADAQSPIQQFALDFTTDFNVAQAESQTFSGSANSISLFFGTTILRDGASGIVPIHFAANGAVSNASFILDLPPNRFASVAVQGSVQLSSASVQSQGSGHYLFSFAPANGQTLQGTQSNLLQLTFTAVTNQISTIFYTVPQNVAVSGSDGSIVPNVFLGAAKIVIVGQQSILETPGPSGLLTFYGKVGSSFVLQSSTNLGATQWTDLRRIPMTNLVQTFSGLTGGAKPLFFRAYEFTANPPLVDARLATNRTGSLTAFGVAGTTYQLQSSTNVSSAVSWNPGLTFTLTNSFQFIDNLPVTNNAIFFRIQKQ